jgi:hypothetical protein
MTLTTFSQCTVVPDHTHRALMAQMIRSTGNVDDAYAEAWNVAVRVLFTGHGPGRKRVLKIATNSPLSSTAPN